MRRHPIDAFSLIAGLIVTAVAVAALLRPWRLDIGTWVGPTLLIAAGVVILGLVAAGPRGRRDDPTDVAGEQPSGLVGPGTGTASAPADATDPADPADPERADALSAAYAELDDDMTVRLEHTPADDDA